MAGGSDDDPGFWPGYVAATAGLVQGLLIVSMALGVSIFGLGQLAEMEIENLNKTAAAKVIANQAKAAAEEEAAQLVVSVQNIAANFPSISASIVALKPSVVKEQQRKEADQAQLTDPDSVSPEPLGLDALLEQAEKEWARPEKAGRSINVAFVADAVTIPDSSSQEIRAAIQKDAMSGAKKWRVFIPADATDPRSVRAGYLRLIALRQALMDAGVSSGGIELKIREEKVSEDEVSLAELIPIGADNQPLRVVGAAE
jgi:hypothetical protein